MPRTAASSNDFPGLDLVNSPDDAGCIDLMNVDLPPGAVRSRDGYSKLTSAAGSTRYDSVFPIASGTTTLHSTKGPGTVADDSSEGSVAWSNPSNATSSNETFATASLSSGANFASHYLKATNLGFAIPGTVTVTGILVEVERGATGAGIQDLRIQLVKGGTIQSTSRADGGVDWPTSGDKSKAYGSASDLWGTTWTPANVNASDFGVAIRAQWRGVSGSATAQVDYVQITVYYTVINTGYVLAGAATSRIDAINSDGSVAVTVATASDEQQSYAALGSPSATAVYIANRQATIRKYSAATFSQPAGMPKAKFVAVQSPDNRLVAANVAQVPTGASSTATTSLVHFSAAGNAESWGANDFVYLTPGDGEDIQGMAAWRELLFIWKATKFFVFHGNSTDASGGSVFNYRSVTTGVGLAAPLAVALSPRGVYFLDRRGIYLTVGGQPERVSEAIDPLFIGGASDFYTGGSANPSALSQVSMCWFNDRLFVGFPSGSASTNDRTLVYDPGTEKWVLWDIPIGAMCALGSQPSRLVFTYAQGTNDIGLYAEHAYSDDAGTAITSHYRTGFSDLGEPGVEKDIAQATMWGTGTVQYALSKDFKALSEEVGPAVDVTLGTSPTIARASANVGGSGTAFSHQFASGGAWRVHRFQHDVRGPKPPGSHTA